MVSITNLFSTQSFSKAMVDNALAAHSPTFELQFNILQNTIIDRLNDKIKDAQAETQLENTIDPFLLAEEKKLLGFSDDLRRFKFFNSKNINAAGELLRQLDTMDTALTDNDTDAFNTALTRVNDTISKMTRTHGVSVGIFIDDGIHAIRRDGLVKYDDGSGNTDQASELSDFASTSDARDAVTAAHTKVLTIASVLLLKGEAVESVQHYTEKELRSTILQVQAARIANEAEKAAEIAKLQESYAQLLNALSLAFETQRIQGQQFAKQLFSLNKIPSGSILNLFS